MLKQGEYFFFLRKKINTSMTIKIEEYFANKGIKVRYNTLGNDETLVKAFVHNFQNDVDSSSGKSSQYVKDDLYGRLYPIKSRTKLTGFEKFKKMDIGFRTKMSPVIPLHFTPLMAVDKTTESSSIDYKDALKNSLKTIENPLLYLSGGIDSELVCLALLDAGIQFQTVMFEWVDDTDFILNEEDLSFAREFCRVHNISPIVERVNVQSLWKSLEFEQMAIDIGIVSPQIITHAYSIQLMSKKFPDVTHLFGGEVRFQSDYLLDNGEQTNLVYLDKVFYPGYNGVTYTLTENGGGFGVDRLALYLSYGSLGPGYWSVTTDGVGSLATSPITAATYGQWTTTPGSSYQYRITAVSSTVSSPYAVPDIAPTAYAAVQDVIVSLGPLGVDGGSTQNWAANWTIQVRVVGQATPVCTTTIYFALNAIG